MKKRILILIFIFLVAMSHSTALASPADYNWDLLSKDDSNELKTLSNLEKKESGKSTSYDAPYVKSPTLIEFQGKLYSIWVERCMKYSDVYVKVYDNGKWSPIDTKPLNYKAGRGGTPKAIVYQDKLYIMYKEYHGFKNPSSLTLKKYDGKKWSTIDKLDKKLIHPGSDAEIYSYDMTIYKDKLYIGWTEYTSNPDLVEVNLRAYDGSKLDKIKHNVFNGVRARDLDLISDEAKIYITFVSEDEDYFSTVRVAEFYDNTVNFIDTLRCTLLTLKDGKEHREYFPSDTPGITSMNGGHNNVNSPQLAILNNELYIIYIQNYLNMMSGGMSYETLMMRKYTGEDWVYVPESQNLNMLKRNFEHANGEYRTNSPNSAYTPNLLLKDSKLYIAWVENQCINDQSISTLCIKSFDGASWDVIADGSQSSGYDANVPQLALYNGKIYVTWKEDDTNVYVKGFSPKLAK